MKFFLIIFVFLSLNTNAKSIKNKFILTEDNLLSIIKKDNPTIESINLIIQQSILDEKKFNRNYDFKVFGSLKYNKANNKITPYDFMLTNNESNFSFGIDKQSVYGVGFKVYTSDNSGNYYLVGQNEYDLNRSFFTINYTMDLWKNFLGYQTLTNKLNLELNKKQSDLKAKIEKNKFVYLMRSTYWKLIIKDKELKFYKEMVDRAEKNLSIVKNKEKTYIADKGDVAKAKANLNLKKVAYENTKLEIKQILMQLKNNVPSLINNDVIVDSFNLSDIFSMIKICNKNIYNKNDMMSLTTYSDYINNMDKMIKNQLKMVEREDDLDVKLGINANFKGIDKNLNSSYKDLGTMSRNDYSISLNISKAIGFNSIEEDNIKLLKMNYNVNKNSTLANISSFYYSYEDIMSNMFNNLNNLKNYKSNMEKTFKNSEYKYNQGRISLTDLLNDENALIDANIKLISMEGNIINVLLNYLSIFDKTECKFNKNI